ncbi:GntR family transcriptional regulator [uncultured Cohaesibacter sp.]|uniref:GntR family transcriptional regulator n=1 Tax=uncultured Cohaesibacter sp. TaxID=1002546 RepID=UPI0029C9168B|nr:GntR family transcriptional regulator [uncultured Cohaesibacter sp.]
MNRTWDIKSATDMVDLGHLIQHVREVSDLEMESATPLYLRIERGIEQSIEAGLVAINDALPAERELAHALGVSRVTVRNAVRVLVQKGILVQRHGAGTFVASRVAQRPRQITGFTEDMQIRGLSTSALWLDRSSGTPTPEECEALEIMPDDAVSRLYRLRTVDGKPVCLEHAVLPKSVLPDPAMIETSLYSWLETHHQRPTRCMQKLSARLLDVSHAHLLEVPTGSACLYVERRSFLKQNVMPDHFETEARGMVHASEPSNGRAFPSPRIGLVKQIERPIEFVRAHFRGDLYEFVSESVI